MSADDVRRVQDEGLALFRRKNADYGNAYKHYGAVGVIVRMGDKIQRMASITSREVRLVDDETLRDTLLDLHNYSAMAIALLDQDRKPRLTIRTDGTKGPPLVPPAPRHREAAVKGSEGRWRAAVETRYEVQGTKGTEECSIRAMRAREYG